MVYHKYCLILLLKSIVTKYRSIKLFDNKPHITTYADDSAILSNSENDMKLMLETLFDTSKELGKKFFLLDNKVISSLGLDEYETYLGIPIGVKSS